MDNTRRSFLKGTLLAAALAAVPGPLKTFLRIPASQVVRWGGLSHSTVALRASWPAIAAVTARVAATRAWLVAAGASAAAALKSFVEKHRFLPPWYDERFKPSLRSVLDGKVR